MDSIYTLLFAAIAIGYVVFVVIPDRMKPNKLGKLEDEYNAANEYDTVTINVNITVRKRWVPHLLGMFYRMEYLGAVGSSRMVGFFSDGDGDFRPKFELNGHSLKTYDQINGRIAGSHKGPHEVKEVFDAG